MYSVIHLTYLVCILKFAVYSAQCAVCSVAVCSLQCTVYSVHLPYLKPIVVRKRFTLKTVIQFESNPVVESKKVDEKS